MIVAGWAWDDRILAAGVWQISVIVGLMVIGIVGLAVWWLAR